ncbi:MAG: amidase family protein, partial [Sphingobium sp.]
MTLAGLRAALDGGEVSRAELFAQTVRAMADLNTVLNLAIPAENGEGSDVAPSLRGVRKGALDGIPLAHKDMFDRRDHRCSFGARMRQQRPPRRTATAITRLEAAGAVTFGALQMAEYALGPTGHNLVFGDCRNPWNPDHVTGGSSSGSAAAVAA